MVQTTGAQQRCEDPEGKGRARGGEGQGWGRGGGGGRTEAPKNSIPAVLSRSSFSAASAFTDLF